MGEGLIITQKDCYYTLYCNIFWRRYPERPVILMAACSAMNSCAYIIRAVVGREAVACDPTGEHLVLDALSNTWCVVVFSISYFFSASSSVWWVILTVSFYLSAGCKWSREAIESRAATYFHVVAWSVPAIATVTALALRRVETDELTGMCLVGTGDRDALLAFVVAPLLTCLVAGSALVAAGFAAMFRIRSDLMRQRMAAAKGAHVELEAQGETTGLGEIRSLEKLMVKIGVFSVLHTVPQTCVVACSLYQWQNVAEWRRLTVETECRLSEDCSLDESIAPVEVQLLRVVMLIAGGATSAMWICSRKTLDTWYQWFTGQARSTGYYSRRWVVRGSHGTGEACKTKASVEVLGNASGYRLATLGDAPGTVSSAYRKCDPSAFLLQSKVPRTRL
jgi:Frizzled/Smoothened family membrane region